MANILDQIEAHKHLEIKQLYENFDFDTLRQTVVPSAKSFYRALSAARGQKQPFFIAEFKRKSPSEGWINRDADVCAQVRSYTRAGAGAISVLTDTEFFGGSYADLQQAAQTLDALPGESPLLLQKDFILDPIQIYLARLHGADIILLIAAILPPERLPLLQKTAESLGMGVLVEVHDREELEKIKLLDFPVLGINNRDLKTFRTALNRVNVLSVMADNRFIIAESGIHDYRDFQVVRGADGFLIGTSLMRESSPAPHFPSLFKTLPAFAPLLFKACGIRTSELLDACPADFIGINFSPVSKRRIEPDVLEGWDIPAHAVAVFYKNSETEIREILSRFAFRRVQLYAGDVPPAFIRSLWQKVILACRLGSAADLEPLEDYASDVDMFILDGARPGSGERIGAVIPPDFPYPFLLAGGLNVDNLDVALAYHQCIGVDVASGIETDGVVDVGKVSGISERLRLL
jgi:indole-3-glycerol phosphate synthase/phosphoribosylanthranilate isomerase